MIEHDLSGAVWHKSSYSNNGGACVEVATNLPAVVAARDSKHPNGPKLVISATEWRCFLAAYAKADSTRLHVSCVNLVNLLRFIASA